MDVGTKKSRTEIVVNTDPVTAHKTFVTRVWWGGGFPWYLPMPASTVIRAQRDESGVGGIRQVPGFIQEEILETQLGKYLEYTLIRKVFAPISYHRGRISFNEIGPNQTQVVWEVSYTPYPLIGFFFLLMLATFDMFFLPSLKLACEEKKAQ